MPLIRKIDRYGQTHKDLHLLISLVSAFREAISTNDSHPRTDIIGLARQYNGKGRTKRSDFDVVRWMTVQQFIDTFDAELAAKCGKTPKPVATYEYVLVKSTHEDARGFAVEPKADWEAYLKKCQAASDLSCDFGSERGVLTFTDFNDYSTSFEASDISTADATILKKYFQSGGYGDFPWIDFDVDPDDGGDEGE